VFCGDHHHTDNCRGMPSRRGNHLDVDGRCLEAQLIAVEIANRAFVNVAEHDVI
jgi:hypothetical protein